MDAIKLLGGLLGNNSNSSNLLGTLMKGAMGGGSAPQHQGAGGLLGGLLGGGGRSSSGAGGGGIMGSILKAAVMKQMGMGSGSAAGSGGLGGLLGGLLGGDAPAAVEQEDPLAGVSQQEANQQATLLIRAMCNAAKADGQVDKSEQQAIIEKLGGDLDQAEADFLRQELSTPLDAAGFARTVPRELAPTVYAMSVMTVNVDTRQEATYLGQLAQGLGLDHNEVSQIHQQLGLG